MHVVQRIDLAEQEAVAVCARFPNTTVGVKHHHLLGVAREENSVREELEDEWDDVGIGSDCDELATFTPGRLFVHDGEGQLVHSDEVVPGQNGGAAFGALLCDATFVQVHDVADGVVLEAVHVGSESRVVGAEGVTL